MITRSHSKTAGSRAGVGEGEDNNVDKKAAGSSMKTGRCSGRAVVMTVGNMSFMLSIRRWPYLPLVIMPMDIIFLMIVFEVVLFVLFVTDFFYRSVYFSRCT